jgi:hypothetical protein
MGIQQISSYRQGATFLSAKPKSGSDRVQKKQQKLQKHTPPKSIEVRSAAHHDTLLAFAFFLLAF